ncbi:MULTISPECIES: DNA cytosine methyltransferase [Pseudomonas]|jgi:DNA (cytosine-5)-methyltransferase 1|uniref:DNA (cytosine-5-)-methyltransferase n=1 Tax=Pseudomonas putida (strain ATCC 47054 / DSM 6125 / CFBP 8728 / NCIMB 11950 / KT2440) TaxID=160488 RepID=Q88IH0_PSEPK|nr:MULTISPECIES: DNA cytosine methyltransferase [Pseudomonas]AAN68637.1 DNA cytosine methyltransferase family protein [Pseudomonas putida KT2440]KMU97703.1 multidrug DMT transporter [Pseudomonas putida]KMY35282.1 multidrug DMT transporter [Pseudomonas putida]MDD2080925.1 DNA cytosine methyltransferase [Pseudomonas putida]PXZ53330.1 DNA cytosine methyltransferase [Pseudomonas sp. SMT-1]
MTVAQQISLEGAQQHSLPFSRELYVDLFAGAGGASSGGARAYRDPDIAINHNPIAIAVHRANHRKTRHYICDIYEVDPLEATGGQPVGILWASPDCRHFSKAKGGAPRSKAVRSLPWVVVHWVFATRPRLLLMENVEEFQAWGPLNDEGKPIKSEMGRTFKAFVACLTTGLPADHPDMSEVMDCIGQWVPMDALVRGLGCNVEWRERRASNAGSPTIRKRLFLIGRTDGRPIVWTKPKRHENPKPGQLPWRTAAECIDFSDLGKSLFARKRPLVDNTCRRVAKGFWRHTVMAEQPFVLQLDEQKLAAASLTEFANASTQRTFSAGEPLRTQVAQIKGGHFALAAAHLTHLTHHGDRSGYPVSEPTRTITGANRGEQALITASMITLRKGSTSSGMDHPVNALTTGSGHHAVAACHFEQANGGFYKGDGRAAKVPLSTILGRGTNQRLASAYLVKYYGTGGQWQDMGEPMHTLPTKERMALVTVVQVPAAILPPELLVKARKCAHFLHKYLPEHFPDLVDLVLLGEHALVDFTLRMLKAPELKLAQGFSPDYILDRGLFENQETGHLEWRPINKTDQIRLIGNSVCPDEAEDLIAANAKDLIDLYQQEAA